MNLLNMRTVGLAIVFFNPSVCYAAAPLYFDLGGLIIFVVLYLIGLLGIPAIIATLKKPLLICLMLALYVGYLFFPVVYITRNDHKNSNQNSDDREKSQSVEKQNIDAFNKYCADRKQVVHHKVNHTGGVSILVQFDESFNGDRGKFNAYTLFEYLGNKPELCARTGVSTLEGIYDGDYLVEKKVFLKEVWRYSMCTKDKWTVVPEEESRYELLLGKTWSEESSNVGTVWPMSSTSVHIMDRMTGEVLAEDMLYFLQGQSGIGKCAEVKEQISNLLIKVFGQ